MHLQVGIALEAIDRDQRQSIARREAFLSTTIAADLPRRANQVRELVGRRP
jgi:hypothetical protein